MCRINMELCFAFRRLAKWDLVVYRVSFALEIAERNEEYVHVPKEVIDRVRWMGDIARAYVRALGGDGGDYEAVS